MVEDDDIPRHALEDKRRHILPIHTQPGHLLVLVGTAEALGLAELLLELVGVGVVGAVGAGDEADRARAGGQGVLRTFPPAA